jgi:disulfide bond formation protein DsbB
MADDRNLKDREQNWADLANHLKDKVHKRTSEVTFLQAKAGFLIAAAVVLLQIITDLPRLTDSLAIASYVLAIALAFASIIVSIVSMHIGKSPTPLNPDDMILKLTEQPQMTREVFANWLAKSYALANKDFNKVYNSKYNQQVASAILLVTSFGIVIILKGVSTYV